MNHANITWYQSSRFVEQDWRSLRKKPQSVAMWTISWARQFALGSLRLWTLFRLRLMHGLMLAQPSIGLKLSRSPYFLIHKLVDGTWTRMALSGRPVQYYYLLHVPYNEVFHHEMTYNITYHKVLVLKRPLRSNFPSLLRAQTLYLRNFFIWGAQSNLLWKHRFTCALNEWTQIDLHAAPRGAQRARIRIQFFRMGRVVFGHIFFKYFFPEGSKGHACTRRGCKGKFMLNYSKILLRSKMTSF